MGKLNFQQSGSYEAKFQVCRINGRYRKCRFLENELKWTFVCFRCDFREGVVRDPISISVRAAQLQSESDGQKIRTSGIR